MIDHVGDQLAGRGLGLDAGDELAARRPHHLDLDLREALVKRLDDLLFDLGEIRGVVDQLAFRFRCRDQFGRAELLLSPRRCGIQRDAETGEAGDRNDPGNDLCVHGQIFLSFYLSRAGDTALSRPPRQPVCAANENAEQNRLHQTECSGLSEISSFVVI